MITVEKQYWWNGNENFGDAIGPIITRHLLKKDLQLARGGDANVLLGPGSIIDYCSKFKSSIVWGTGIDPHYGKKPQINPSITFLAVRGPQTRKHLGIDVKVMGDPGILMPEIYPKTATREGPVSIVVHHSTLKRRLRDRVFDPHRSGYKIISPCQDYQSVIDEICSSSFVFCQSLHGAIMAEAYDVPWAWWKGFHGRFATFKWQDWFGSIGAEPRAFFLHELTKAKLWSDKLKKTPIDRNALKDVLLSNVE